MDSLVKQTLTVGTVLLFRYVSSLNIREKGCFTVEGKGEPKKNNLVTDTTTLESEKFLFPRRNTILHPRSKRNTNTSNNQLSDGQLQTHQWNSNRVDTVARD